jgi:3-oxoacyl-[acyl-carrier-protein] synthase-3
VSELDVYITQTASVLPNDPVDNDKIESVLGMVANRPSRTKRIILRQNGISERYYVLDPITRQPNYTNAQLTAEAVRKLFASGNGLNEIDCLASGTTLADQIAPNHGLMVHGELKTPPCEVIATSGICLSGISALKYAYMSVKCGDHSKAVSTGSETASIMLRSEKYYSESDYSDEDIKKHPELCFEKDFLRWLLSDGAGAFLLEPQLNGHHTQTVVKIEWLKIYSFANKLKTCMYMGAQKNQDGNLTSWTNYSHSEIQENAILTIQQDVRLLNENIIDISVHTLERVREETGLKAEEVDYFLPHLSSMYFFDRFEAALKKSGFHVPREKWFTNLPTKGNTGSASIYIMLDELLKSGRCKSGEKILCFVPESGRFSSAYMLLTVV